MSIIRYAGNLIDRFVTKGGLGYALIRNIKETKENNAPADPVIPPLPSDETIRVFKPELASDYYLIESDQPGVFKEFTIGEHALFDKSFKEVADYLSAQQDLQDAKAVFTATELSFSIAILTGRIDLSTFSYESETAIRFKETKAAPFAPAHSVMYSNFTLYNNDPIIIKDPDEVVPVDLPVVWPVGTSLRARTISFDIDKLLKVKEFKLNNIELVDTTAGAITEAINNSQLAAETGLQASFLNNKLTLTSSSIDGISLANLAIATAEPISVIINEEPPVESTIFNFAPFVIDINAEDETVDVVPNMGVLNGEKFTIVVDGMNMFDEITIGSYSKTNIDPNTVAYELPTALALDSSVTVEYDGFDMVFTVPAGETAVINGVKLVTTNPIEYRINDEDPVETSAVVFDSITLSKAAAEVPSDEEEETKPTPIPDPETTEEDKPAEDTNEETPEESNPESPESPEVTPPADEEEPAVPEVPDVPADNEPAVPPSDENTDTPEEPAVPPTDETEPDNPEVTEPEAPVDPEPATDPEEEQPAPVDETESEYIPEPEEEPEKEYIPEEEEKPDTEWHEPDELPENIPETEYIEEPAEEPDTEYVEEPAEEPETEYVPEPEEEPEKEFIPEPEEQPDAEHVPELEDNSVEEVESEEEFIPEPEELPDAEYIPEPEEQPDMEYIEEPEETPDMEFIPEEEELPDSEYVPEEEELPDTEWVPEEEELPEAEYIPEEEEQPDTEFVEEPEELPETEYVEDETVYEDTVIDRVIENKEAFALLINKGNLSSESSVDEFVFETFNFGRVQLTKATPQAVADAINADEQYASDGIVATYNEEQGLLVEAVKENVNVALEAVQIVSRNTRLVIEIDGEELDEQVNDLTINTLTLVTGTAPMMQEFSSVEKGELSTDVFIVSPFGVNRGEAPVVVPVPGDEEGTDVYRQPDGEEAPVTDAIVPPPFKFVEFNFGDVKLQDVDMDAVVAAINETYQEQGLLAQVDEHTGLTIEGTKDFLDLNVGKVTIKSNSLFVAGTIEELTHPEMLPAFHNGVVYDSITFVTQMPNFESGSKEFVEDDTIVEDSVVELDPIVSPAVLFKTSITDGSEVKFKEFKFGTINLNNTGLLEVIEAINNTYNESGINAVYDSEHGFVLEQSKEEASFAIEDIVIRAEKPFAILPLEEYESVETTEFVSGVTIASITLATKALPAETSGSNEFIDPEFEVEYSVEEVDPLQGGNILFKSSIDNDNETVSFHKFNLGKVNLDNVDLLDVITAFNTAYEEEGLEAVFDQENKGLVITANNENTNVELTPAVIVPKKPMAIVVMDELEDTDSVEFKAGQDFKSITLVSGEVPESFTGKDEYIADDTIVEDTIEDAEPLSGSTILFKSSIDNDHETVMFKEFTIGEVSLFDKPLLDVLAAFNERYESEGVEAAFDQENRGFVIQALNEDTNVTLTPARIKPAKPMFIAVMDEIETLDDISYKSGQDFTSITVVGVETPAETTGSNEFVTTEDDNEIGLEHVDPISGQILQFKFDVENAAETVEFHEFKLGSVHLVNKPLLDVLVAFNEAYEEQGLVADFDQDNYGFTITATNENANIELSPAMILPKQKMFVGFVEELETLEDVEYGHGKDFGVITLTSGEVPAETSGSEEFVTDETVYEQSVETVDPITGNVILFKSALTTDHQTVYFKEFKLGTVELHDKPLLDVILAVNEAYADSNIEALFDQENKGFTISATEENVNLELTPAKFVTQDPMFIGVLDELESVDGLEYKGGYDFTSITVTSGEVPVETTGSNEFEEDGTTYDYTFEHKEPISGGMVLIKTDLASDDTNTTVTFKQFKLGEVSLENVDLLDAITEFNKVYEERGLEAVFDQENHGMVISATVEDANIELTPAVIESKFRLFVGVMDELESVDEVEYLNGVDFGSITFVTKSVPDMGVGESEYIPEPEEVPDTEYIEEPEELPDAEYIEEPEELPDMEYIEEPEELPETEYVEEPEELPDTETVTDENFNDENPVESNTTHYDPLTLVANQVNTEAFTIRVPSADFVFETFKYGDVTANNVTLAEATTQVSEMYDAILNFNLVEDTALTLSAKSKEESIAIGELHAKSTVDTKPFTVEYSTLTDTIVEEVSELTAEATGIVLQELIDGRYSMTANLVTIKANDFSEVRYGDPAHGEVDTRVDQSVNDVFELLKSKFDEEDNVLVSLNEAGDTISIKNNNLDTGFGIRLVLKSNTGVTVTSDAVVGDIGEQSGKAIVLDITLDHIPYNVTTVNTTGITKIEVATNKLSKLFANDTDYNAFDSVANMVQPLTTEYGNSLNIAVVENKLVITPKLQSVYTLDGVLKFLTNHPITVDVFVGDKVTNYTGSVAFENIGFAAYIPPLEYLTHEPVETDSLVINTKGVIEAFKFGTIELSNTTIAAIKKAIDAKYAGKLTTAVAGTALTITAVSEDNVLAVNDFKIGARQAISLTLTPTTGRSKQLAGNYVMASIPFKKKETPITYVTKTIEKASQVQAEVAEFRYFELGDIQLKNPTHDQIAEAVNAKFADQGIVVTAEAPVLRIAATKEQNVVEMGTLKIAGKSTMSYSLRWDKTRVRGLDAAFKVDTLVMDKEVEVINYATIADKRANFLSVSADAFKEFFFGTVTARQVTPTQVADLINATYQEQGILATGVDSSLRIAMDKAGGEQTFVTKFSSAFPMSYNFRNGTTNDRGAGVNFATNLTLYKDPDPEPVAPPVEEEVYEDTSDTTLYYPPEPIFTDKFTISAAEGVKELVFTEAEINGKIIRVVNASAYVKLINDMAAAGELPFRAEGIARSVSLIPVVPGTSIEVKGLRFKSPDKLIIKYNDVVINDLQGGSFKRNTVTLTDGTNTGDQQPPAEGSSPNTQPEATQSDPAPATDVSPEASGGAATDAPEANADASEPAATDSPSEEEPPMAEEEMEVGPLDMEPANLDVRPDTEFKVILPRNAGGARDTRVKTLTFEEYTTGEGRIEAIMSDLISKHPAYAGLITYNAEEHAIIISSPGHDDGLLFKLEVHLPVTQDYTDSLGNKSVINSDAYVNKRIYHTTGVRLI